MDRLHHDIQTTISEAKANVLKLLEGSEDQTTLRTILTQLNSIDEDFTCLMEKVSGEKKIMKAKHKLMQQNHWSEDRAYKHLQRTAKQRRIKIVQLAEEILQEEGTPPCLRDNVLYLTAV